MFSVILLMAALYVLSSLQKRTSSQICFGESGSNRAQQVAVPCAVLAPTALLLCWRDLTRPRYAHTKGGPPCPRSSCRTFFCMLSASGLDALISRVSHTVEERDSSARPCRLPWVWVPLSSSRWPLLSLFGSADGSSKLPSRLQYASTAFLLMECCLWRLGCRANWACRLSRIVGDGKSKWVRRTCAYYVCKSPQSSAQMLQLVGGVISSSAQVM